MPCIYALGHLKGICQHVLTGARRASRGRRLFPLLDWNIRAVCEARGLSFWRDIFWGMERDVSMKRMCGFALFCFSMGMLVMLMIHNRFIGFFLVIICMLAGYYIFCCD